MYSIVVPYNRVSSIPPFTPCDIVKIYVIFYNLHIYKYICKTYVYIYTYISHSIQAFCIYVILHVCQYIMYYICTCVYIYNHSLSIIEIFVSKFPTNMESLPILPLTSC